MNIKEKLKEILGLVDNDSDKDLELKDLSKIQNQIDDVRDSLIAEQETKIREEQAEESNEWKEKMQKARAKQLRAKKVRDAQKHNSRISPQRQAMLRRLGKLK